ncbi:MAG: PQQ-like beta-propeller repeat protein [Lentisphaerae bacterium]|nr:PQQ-like beta-propeller repeat protein [Lentisphaerota bacterium]
MITSFNALYDESRSRGKTPDLDATPRLIKGPAYVRPADAANATEDDWPTYRKTNSRSGATASEYDGELNVTWQTKLSTTPTAPVVVGDRVFVAARDSHILYGLSRKTGKISWTFTADGRIDSPPTYYRGLLLFGSRAGWVYAVNANDGTLAWKFMDLPEKRLISARGQLESAWPVNGSVMVHANLAYFAAGRQSFIDGGVVVYALNPLTGKVLHRRRMYGPVDDKGFHIPRKAGFRSEGFKSGIFSSEHDLLFIRHQAFKPDLTPVPLDDITSTHLLASPGFLDDTPQHRTYWSIDTDLHYGPGNGKPGAGPQGDILCFEGDVFYDVRGYLPGRHSTTFKPQKGCTLFSGERAKGEKPRNSELFPKKGQWKERWAKQIPMAGHALILAGDTVVVAGVPLESSYSNTDFSSSFAGNKGGVIWTVAKGDGARIASLKLPSPPVWDGLASAGGQCFVATQDGTVVCFGDGNLESKQKDWKK